MFRECELEACALSAEGRQGPAHMRGGDFKIRYV